MCDSHYSKFIENIDNNITNIDIIKLQKMMFIFNALENGWTIKKVKDCYVFKKIHDDDEEIFRDSYLTTFINNNIKSCDEILLSD